MTNKTYNAKKTDRGIWEEWYFTISTIKLTENDQLSFNCWNENQSVLEFTILLNLRERGWLQKILQSLSDSFNSRRVKVHIRKDNKNSEVTINFGSVYSDWYILDASLSKT